MSFRAFDSLHLFLRVAKHSSFSAAAQEVHRTKGAVSHQMRQLEAAIGFPLFTRLPRGIALTPQGQTVLAAAETAFDEVERTIAALRNDGARTLTIGVTTYFASRWLSPRLMDFMRQCPDIRLRLQPMIDLVKVADDEVDVAIRWGDGTWQDMTIEPLFTCPAWPTGNAAAFEQVRAMGVAAAFNSFTLLRDRDDSTAWSDWFAAADLPYHARADTLIIPDPNVRVQAVIDGQGVALNDALVEEDIAAQRLFRLSDAALSHYGYHLAYTQRAAANPAVAAFCTWIKQEA